MIESTTELTAIKVKLINKELYVTGLYLSHNSDFDILLQHLKSLLNEFNVSNRNVCFAKIGDYRINILVKSSQTNKLKCALYEHNHS